MGGHCDYSAPGKINLDMPLAMEKQKTRSLYLHSTSCTYVAVHNAISIESVAVEAQQRVLCIVALHTSLLTIRDTQVFT